jgi:type IX secretion system PorP/SprF family membrane protein
MRLIIIIFCSCFTLVLNAQDIHFSQFNISKVNLNPALTGIQDNDFQANFQRRSQWSSVADPFKTISLSVYAKNYFSSTSLGLNFINDNSGDANFKTSGLNISLSQIIIKNKISSFSVGGLIGAFQRTYDISSLVFIEDESIINESVFFLDIAFGGLVTRKINDMMTIEAGLAAYHLNNPDQSFSLTSQLSTPIKYNFHFISKYYIMNNLNLEGSFFSSKQSSFEEIIYGIDFNYSTHNELYNNLQLSLGIYNRYKDAIIPKLGLDMGGFSVNLSYDINVSDLSIATNNYGGLEFSIVYSWNLKNKELKKEFICPKYL